jgi:membrane fusion protein, multidrug efflux system
MMMVKKIVSLARKYIAFIGILYVLAACGGKTDNNQQPAAVPVNVTEARLEKVTFYEDYPGRVVALNEVELRSEVSGFVTGIFFSEGSFVKKGQILYEIDRSRYQASYGQAKANVDIALANEEKARRNVDRYTKLSEQDAIARQRVEDAETDLKNASLQVVSAKEGLVRAETDLNHSLITAPFDGTIGISQVKMGSLISPGQTLLNTISSDDPIGVDFVVNERNLNAFQQLSENDRSPGDSVFTISMPDRSPYPGKGKIQVIDRAIDPQTGTVRIRLIFPNREKWLRDGMSCLVHVLNRNDNAQLVIPSEALMEQMSEYFVFVVDSQKVKQTKVVLGPQLKDKVVVLEGIREGQQIVTDGIQKLRNGATVAINSGNAGQSSK